MSVSRPLLSFQKCKLNVLQWFQQEEDSWESEHHIRDSIHWDAFWKEIKGGKRAVKIGQKKQAPDDKIREFFFYPSCCYLIRMNLVQWQEEYLYIKFVDRLNDDPADVDLSVPVRIPVGKHLKGW